LLHSALRCLVANITVCDGLSGIDLRAVVTHGLVRHTTVLLVLLALHNDDGGNLATADASVDAASDAEGDGDAAEHNERDAEARQFVAALVVSTTAPGDELRVSVAKVAAVFVAVGSAAVSANGEAGRGAGVAIVSGYCGEGDQRRNDGDQQ